MKYWVINVLLMYVFATNVEAHAVGSKKTVCDTSYWADQLDSATIKDAWHTYHHFARQCYRVMTKEQFDTRVKKAKKLCVTDEQFIAMGVGNERLERYWDKKTPEEVYPEGDRPRGQTDITSITYLMHTTKLVNPVLLGHLRYKDGFEQLLVLDGMHRIIAAHLSNRSLVVFVVDLR